MDRALPISWLRYRYSRVRAAHARNTREWIRRIEVPGQDPSRRW